MHVLAADGLFAPDGRFHCMPAEDLAPSIDLFRHRFLHALREAKLISPKKLTHLLSWKHSGFHIHAGAEQLVRPNDHAGRKRLAEYLLRHPFSLQKITWNATTKTVIYRSKRHHTTKRNFEVFKAPDFIAAILRFRKGSFEWQAIGKAHVSEEYPPTTSAKASGGEGLLMQELYCSRSFTAVLIACFTPTFSVPSRTPSDSI
ncbi:transposase, partial [Haloferula sp.]|uniref:transposase n=1 Tax=Haloferula sp. TaxID=2497595 RepID=UPI003C709EC9